MIKDATFTSVWDGGIHVTTACKVNMDTKEVFDITASEGTADMVNELDNEFVTLDGVDYPVYNRENDDTEGFWYE